jgi:hypothetical protein
MAARSCGEFYRCCVGLDIPELKKYQDHTWGHLAAGIPPLAARSTIIAQPAAVITSAYGARGTSMTRIAETNPVPSRIFLSWEPAHRTGRDNR